MQCPQLRSELDRLGPKSDFFEQSGGIKVWIDHQKSEFVDENNVQILIALKNFNIEGKLIVYDPSSDLVIGLTCSAIDLTLVLVGHGGYFFRNFGQP